MNAIKVSPDLLMHYAQMTRNEVTLHMAIKALAEDGRKLKRNMYLLAKVLGKGRNRLHDAEFRLKRKKFLQVHYTKNGTRDIPYWYVFDQPVGEEVIALPAIVKNEDAIEEEPRKKSVWRRLRDAIVGTELDNFDLTASK